MAQFLIDILKSVITATCNLLIKYYFENKKSHRSNDDSACK